MKLLTRLLFDFCWYIGEKMLMRVLDQDVTDDEIRAKMAAKTIAAMEPYNRQTDSGGGNFVPTLGTHNEEI